MNSMTGYGRASKRDRKIDIEIEARSVNHRFLNIKVSLPEALSRFEGEVEKSIRRRCARGSVTLNGTVKLLDMDGDHLPDTSKVREYYKRLESIRKGLKLKGEISFDALLAIPQLWGADNHINERVEKIWPEMHRMIDRAVDELVEARHREGESIRKDVLQRLDHIDACVAKVKLRAPAVLENYQRKLDERITTILTAKGLEGVKADLVKEVALYADKIDISEELHRLASHVEEFRKSARSSGTMGRKLDFTVQEMVRETNTLASKSADAEVSSLAVQIKSELEKLKEQAENIE